MANVGIYLSLAGVGLSILSLILSSRRYRKGAIAAMPDAELIKYGLWDECDGEPMNDYAEEYERRHGISQGATNA